MTPPSSRRDFLKTGAASAAALTLGSAPLVHAQGSEELKIGLVGCGGRGTGAALNALRADRNVKLWAMGDAFTDRLQGSFNSLNQQNDLRPKINVPGERRFVGMDAYQQVINSGVDVVLLCTPPHFRPRHIAAAVAAGKHMFVEKPVAVDAPGVRSVLDSCAQARRANLSVVSGLCWRYHDGMKETFQRIHDGAVGDIVSLQCTYNTGGLWNRARQAGWSDMEWQVRNWLYFTWLSGDHIVEQAVHSIDKTAWAMRDVPPIAAVATGGRQVRTGEEYGHIFDHFAVIYEYANGIKCFHMSRQQVGTTNEVKDFVWGTRGQVDVMAHRITGAVAWTANAAARRADMYQREHDAMFAAIRAGRPINNGDYMCKSTLLAIMGRMAAYTGQRITWQQAMDSREDLSPPNYQMGPLPVAPVARPGVTRFS